MPDDKSLYAKLNNMYKLESRPLKTNRLINSRELDHSKSFIKRLMSTTIAALKNMKHLQSVQKQSACDEIKHLVMHALATVQNTAYSNQLVSAENETKFKLRKLIMIMRFIDVMNLVIMSVRRAALTEEQKASAISRIRSTYHVVKKNFLKAQKTSSFRGIFTSGVNAMNGSLAEYISSSQAYVLDQLSAMVDKVKSGLDQQTNLSIMAKYLAYRDINAIQDDARNNIMMATSFLSIERVQRRFKKGLGKISRDQDRVLRNLTRFSQFANQLTGIVAKLSRLSADAKMRLETRIDQYQRSVMDNLRSSHKGISDSMLEHKKRYLAQMVIDLVAYGYQQEIIKQTLNLNKKQRQALVHEIQATAKQIIQSFQPQSSFKGSIEQKLTSNLKQLNREMVTRRSNLAYHNQVNQLVSDFKIKVNEVYDLSSASKRRLRIQIETAGMQAQETKPHRKISQMRVDLRKLLSQQVKYIKQSTLRRWLRDLYRQIKISHLKLQQKNYLLKRLTNIKKDSHIEYSDKRLLIKDVSDYGLSLDKSENLKRLTQLNEVIYQQVRSLDISALQGQNLSSDFVTGFSRKIDGVNGIFAIDHIEQNYENRIYGCLYHPKVQLSPLKARALQFPLNQAHEAHRRINVSILQPRLGDYINDRIDYFFNKHLYIILKTKDVHKIKQQLIEIKRGLHNLLSQALVDVRKDYIERINDLAKDICHQVMAYQPVRRSLDATEAMSSHISNDLNGSEDLLHLERANQRGQQKLNAYSSKIIGNINSSKASAHHTVDLMSKSLFNQLGQNNKDFHSTEVTSASQNLVLKITNHAHCQINQDVDENLWDYCQSCRMSLNHILRRNCLQEWFRTVEQAKLKIQKLFYVPLDPRMDSLRSIQSCGLKIANQIKDSDEADLSGILQDNKKRIHQIVRRSVYLDPKKKQARDGLDKLIKSIRDSVKKHVNSKASGKVLDHLDSMSWTIDEQLINCSNKDVKSVSSRSRKQLKEFGLNTIRSAEFKRFDKNTKHLEKQIHQLPLLGDKEFHQIDDKFNVGYHKAIYTIKKASDIKGCVSRERHGEDVIKDLLTHSKHANNKKRLPYLNIKAAVTSAKSQIMSLRNLQKKDKQDSYRLLKQINQQITHDIKESVGADDAKKELKKGRAMVKQVIDKVSSAGVLVSAIKTANNQIANSTLDDKQKKATLRQINQIVNNGIRSQFLQAGEFPEGEQHNPDKTQKPKHHNQPEPKENKKDSPSTRDSNDGQKSVSNETNANSNSHKRKHKPFQFLKKWL